MEYIDLTQTLSEHITVPPGADPPRLRRIKHAGVDLTSVSEYQFRSHVGTHMDSYSHYFPEKDSLDKLPVSTYFGSGYVVHLNLDRLGLLTPDLLEDIWEKGAAGVKFLILSFGWAKHSGTEEYLYHPYLTPDTAKAIVANGVGCIVIDTITPDCPIPLRTAEFDAPVHRVLLGNGVLIVENCASADALADGLVSVAAVPAKIADADGAPVRVVVAPAGTW